MSDRPSPVGARLRAAPPDRLPEALAGQLRRHHGARRVEVLLGDLTLTCLWPVIDPAGPAGGSPAVRCFGSQRPVTDIGLDGVNRVHLPLTVWGERLGVIAGQLEPAYDVHGDHFDWALDGDRLTVTVLNGFGDGLPAALLTTLAVTAMRNARRSGANLVEQAELASDAVHSRHGGGAHAATLLLEIDLVGGWVSAVDAGSPRALIARDSRILPVDLEQQLPLGMFSDTRYEIQRFRLEPADRLLVVSDGVHAATLGGRAPYGGGPA